jgi:hypothetical protein
MEKSRASFRWTLSGVTMSLAASVSLCFAQGNQGVSQETQPPQETQRQETQRSQMQGLEMQRQQQLQRLQEMQRQQQLLPQQQLQRQQQGPVSPSRP